MAKATKSRELAVTTGNRTGLLSEMSDALAAAKVNITSICAYVNDSDQACFLLTVDKHVAARKILGRAGYRVGEDNVIRLEIGNRPGQLAKAAARLSCAGIDINYLYATTIGRNTTVVVKTRDDARALKLLRKK